MARFDFATDSVVVAGCGLPVGPRILQNQRAVPDPRPILRPNLPVAELDYGPLGVDSLDSWLCPSKQAGNKTPPEVKMIRNKTAAVTRRLEKADRETAAAALNYLQALLYRDFVNKFYAL